MKPFESWRVIGAVLFCLAVLWMAGCRPASPQSQAPVAQPELKAAPPTPIAEKKEETGAPTWNPAWDAAIEKSLPAEMLGPAVARKVSPFCPRFAGLPEPDRRAFWAYFFQALAGAEAGLDPTTNVHHASVVRKDSITRRPIRAEGLLQLTYEDAHRYGCDFDWNHDRSLPEKDPARTILSPERNLACGVRILNHQIVEDRKPLLARSSYWATLRPGTASYRHFAAQMKNVPAACRGK